MVSLAFSINFRSLYTLFILLSLRQRQVCFLSGFTIFFRLMPLSPKKFQQMLLKTIPSAPFGLDKNTPPFAATPNGSHQNPIIALCSSWCLSSSAPPNAVLLWLGLVERRLQRLLSYSNGRTGVTGYRQLKQCK